MNRRIASQHRLVETSIRRHAANHLSATLLAAAEAEDVAHAIDVVQQLKAINAACLTVLSDARKVGDGELVLKAVDRVQRQIELQAKLLGDLDERPQINVLVSPQWLVVRSTLLEALQPYPGRQDGRGGPPGGPGADGVIAADLVAGLDPVILARRVGIEPDPWQTDILRSSSPRQFLNASRQSGKSTTVALLNVHVALYQPGSLCLMLSPTLRQSGELFKKALGIYVRDRPHADAGEP